MASDNPFVSHAVYSENPISLPLSNPVYSENPFFFVFPPPNSIFSNMKSKQTLTDSKPKQNSDSKQLKESISLPDLSNHKPPCYNSSSNIAESSYGPRVYQNLEEEIEERRRLDLAAMWPVISANTKSFCIDDAGIAVQIAEANKAFAAAIKAVAAATEAANKVAAATALRMEQLKPETKAPLDSPTQFGFCGSVNEYPAIIELENKISSDEPSCVNVDPADIELENIIYSEKARKALEHYKETNDEEYEFVEIENFETTVLAPFVASHITFKAKPKEKADSCPKLFFAEIYEGFVTDDFEVKMCMILDSCGPDVKIGCGYFHGGKDMLHPSGVEFLTGPLGWDGCKPRNSSSRT